MTKAAGCLNIEHLFKSVKESSNYIIYMNMNKVCSEFMERELHEGYIWEQ